MPEAGAPFVDVEDLDDVGVLAAAEGLVAARRAGEVHELRLVVQWANLHSELPRREPGAEPVRGRPRLVRMGGVGTPEVVDLAVGELAIAPGAHTLATRALPADCLDLRHRLPTSARGGPQGRVRVAGPGPGCGRTGGPGRVSDTDRARERRERERAQRVVAIGRSDEHGLRTARAPTHDDDDHVDQTGIGEYLWRTPHGLHRVVDATGTHRLDAVEAFGRRHRKALDAALDRVQLDLRDA